MSKELKDVSNSLEPLYKDVLLKFDAAAKSMELQYCVVGASAVYILILHYYKKTIRLRKTADIDLSVLINTWQDNDKFVRELIANYGFVETPTEHRLKCKDIIVDIIPFGPIAGEQKTVDWPVSGRKFNVMGFEEVQNSSIPLQISTEPAAVINFASIEGIAILKLLAWNDAFPLRKKDAGDFFVLLQNYIDLDNLERAYEDLNFFEEVGPGFDYILASAKLLAEDIKKTAGPDTLKKLVEILNPEGNRFEKLVINILDNNDLEAEFEKIYNLLAGFYDFLSA